MVNDYLSNIYNISLEKLQQGNQIITDCSIPYDNIFKFFFLPLIIVLILLVLLKYIEPIKLYFLSIFRKRGYIKIMFWLPNRTIKEKIIKLDNFDNFSFKNRKYNLNKMWDFLQGYDKQGFPIFFYDYQFILPLKITKKKITKEIKEQLNITDDEEISAIEMQLESSILHTVYSKRLLSDLYSISKGNIFDQKLIYILLGIAVLIVLYYTGLLDKILDFLGIKV